MADRLRKTKKLDEIHPRKSGSYYESITGSKPGDTEWILFFLLMCTPLALYIGAISNDDDPLLWGSLVAASLIFISIFTRSYGGRFFYLLLIVLSVTCIAITSGIYLGKNIDTTSKNLVISGIVLSGVVLFFYFLLGDDMGLKKDLLDYINTDFAAIDYYNKMKKMKENFRFFEWLGNNPMSKNTFDNLFNKLELEIGCMEKKPEEYKKVAARYTSQQETLSRIEEFIFGDKCSPRDGTKENVLWRNERKDISNNLAEFQEEDDKYSIPYTWCGRLNEPPIITQRMLFKEYLLRELKPVQGKPGKQGQKAPPPRKDPAMMRLLKYA